MASKDQGQSLMTPEDEANWNREVEAQFQSTYSTAKSCRDTEVGHSRKRGEGTKLWTTGAQLADYKIPKLTRYARILQRWAIQWIHRLHSLYPVPQEVSGHPDGITSDR